MLNTTALDELVRFSVSFILSFLHLPFIIEFFFSFLKVLQTYSKMDLRIVHTLYFLRQAVGLLSREIKPSQDYRNAHQNFKTFQLLHTYILRRTNTYMIRHINIVSFLLQNHMYTTQTPNLQPPSPLIKLIKQSTQLPRSMFIFFTYFVFYVRQ
jgi:hypothetical protein